MLAKAALNAWFLSGGWSTGVVDILLNACRSLFPLSIGPFCLILSSLVHDQVRRAGSHDGYPHDTV